MRELSSAEVSAVGGGEIQEVGQCRQLSIQEGVANYIKFVAYALVKMFGG
jgi:hypothetical protein